MSLRRATLGDAGTPLVQPEFNDWPFNVARANIIVGEGFGHCLGELCKTGTSRQTRMSFAALGRELVF